MSENNMMPELTLDPQAPEAAPVLTLDAEVVTPATPAVVEPPEADIVPAKLDDSMLSEAEKQWQEIP